MSAQRRGRALPEWVPTFLEALRRTGKVSISADLAGVRRSSVYRLRNRRDDFREPWDAVLAERRDELLGKLDRRLPRRAREPSFAASSPAGPTGARASRRRE